MGKTIEHIWKEGFLKEDAMVAPRLNNLYSQKSKLILHKIERMFKINLLLILIFSLAILIAGFRMGIPIFGGIIFVLFLGIVFIGRRELKSLKSIDSNLDTYRYVKAFNEWMKQMISVYAKLSRYLYPISFLAVAIGIWFSDSGESIVEQLLDREPDLTLVFGIPLFWLIISLLVATLLSLFASKIYKLDIKIVYGRVCSKLEEIIADMEELRK